jgi:hypothetical protein
MPTDVRRGGHAEPEPTIRRRYKAGLQNLFGFYVPPAARRSQRVRPPPDRSIRWANDFLPVR